MNLGNITGGLVNTVEQVCFDYEVTGSAVSSISTGNILNGNEDGWYTIILRIIGVAAGAATPVMRFNADSGSNYGRRGINATSTTVSDDSGAAETGMYVGYTSGAGQTGFYVGRVYAKSGAVRLVNGVLAGAISTTTVTSLVARSSVWSNTADNLTAISISDAGTQLGVGTRIIILKSNNFTNGTPTGSITTPYIKGAWVRVGSQILSSPASSVTFTGLDGDRDVVYAFSIQGKASGGVTQGFIKPNNDGTAGIYGRQSLTGTNISVATERRTSDPTMYVDSLNNTASGAYSLLSGILFAKSGYVRPAILQYATSVSGTTVTAIGVAGSVYNKADATNITSMVLGTTANNYDTGTQIELYALRPQS